MGADTCLVRVAESRRPPWHLSTTDVAPATCSACLWTAVNCYRIEQRNRPTLSAEVASDGIGQATSRYEHSHGCHDRQVCQVRVGAAPLMLHLWPHLLPKSCPSSPVGRPAPGRSRTRRVTSTKRALGGTVVTCRISVDSGASTP